MNDLVEEIRNCFEKSRDEVTADDPGATVIATNTDELAPGFAAMKTYYESRLLIIMRRGYRHHAGSVLPTDADALLHHTAVFLDAPMIAVSMGVFTDGVMIGHQSDHLVRMMVHFHNVDHLFHDENFRQSSLRMTKGFAEDKEVCEYFGTYLHGALTHMAHITGFAHKSEVVPAKIWDLWLLTGTAVITACYLAGIKMGASWRERDVLDGLEMASEPEGQDGDDQRADEADQGELGSE